MSYRERPAAVRGGVLWQGEGRARGGTPILPDACLDLIWDGSALVVAGPDVRSRGHEASAPTSFVALRLSAGIGPGLLGVPALELRDTSPRLDDVWPAARARELTERVAAAPGPALEAWLRTAAADDEPDPLGARA